MESKVKIRQLVPASNFKVLSISGEAGDGLKQHKVDEQSLLLVRKGRVIYQEAGQEIVLTAGEAQQIPAECYHALYCPEAAEAFVVIPKRAKLQFAK